MARGSHPRTVASECVYFLIFAFLFHFLLVIPCGRLMLLMTILRQLLSARPHVKIASHIVCLHGLVNTNNCNVIRICQSSRTRGNGMKLYKEQCAVSTRDINSSLTALLTFGTLYLQQSFVAPVWLFLNVI